MHQLKVVQEAKRYGTDVDQTPEGLVGTYVFDEVPQPGQPIEMDDRMWVVTEVHGEWIYVTTAAET